MNKRDVGTFYEDVAVRYLEENGVEIIARNYRCRLGEIDLIGRQGKVLIFFEVKYRKSTNYGSSLQAVDVRKQKQIVRTAKYYLTYDRSDSYIRFDVIGIDNDRVEWIKDAFGAS